MSAQVSPAAIAYPPDPAIDRRMEGVIANWTGRPPGDRGTDRRTVLLQVKAGAELLLIGGGDLSLDPYLRNAILAQAHRLQAMLFADGVKLCRRFEIDLSIRKEPLVAEKRT